MLRHAVPYADPSLSCSCKGASCGGIVQSEGCPEHGHRLDPTMSWHIADSAYCRSLARKDVQE